MIMKKLNLKNKLKHQTDGKFDTDKPSKLSKLNKFAVFNSFGSEQSYVDFLLNLSLQQLHEHATNAGEIPIDNRKLLELRLLKRFAKSIEKAVA